MQLEDYNDDDGKKVWLTAEELDDYLLGIDDTEHTIALGLMARSGLRTDETTAVAPQDIVTGPAGAFVRVWEGKNDKYRETPVPPSLAATINAYADVRDAAADDPLVDRNNRTVRRWVTSRADKMDGDEGWSYLSAHDLRRSWGTLLVEDVEPGLVMEWGGWESWETFRDAYLGVYSPRAQREAREQVEWL
jgi:integrase